jgi:hypothetical protein
MSDNFIDNPLQPVVSHWLSQIQQGLEVKKKRFGRDAEEAMRFLVGPYDWMYGESGAGSFRSDSGDAPDPKFKMTLNKVSELVQLFGPSLYSRNPNRKVTPRSVVEMPPELFGSLAQDPAFMQDYQQITQAASDERRKDTIQAQLLERYLNYTPTALDLKTEARWAIDEALIKGMGLLYTQVYTSPASPTKMVGSFYDSVDNLVIDPDMLSLRDAKWCAQRVTMPVWEAERMYGYAPGTLRGNGMSLGTTAQASSNAADDYRRRTGQTNDLLVCWKVYSKMGVGGRLKGIAAHLAEPLEQYGDFCLIVVCDSVPYPLNVRPEMMDAPGALDLIKKALQWESPFWADGGWPFTPIKFHDIPNDVWPMSHIAPGFGELKFLNWLYSFIAGKISVTCRDFIAMRKGTNEEVKSAILSGQDLTLLEIDTEHAGTIDQVVQFLQHPQFNGDIWKVADAMMELFEKRVGLIELMYGQTGSSMRSAQEAEQKSKQMNIRPDDMANTVEDAMGEMARKEGLAARWHLTPEDMLPVLGPQGAQFWATFIYTADPSEILHQLEYRVEAGSSRKPNRDRDTSNMTAAMQNLFQPLFQTCTATGNFDPVNALVRAWGKTMDLNVDELGILFPTPPPPQPAPPPQGQGGPPPQPQPQQQAAPQQGPPQ